MHNAICNGAYMNRSRPSCQPFEILSTSVVTKLLIFPTTLLDFFFVSGFSSTLSAAFDFPLSGPLDLILDELPCKVLSRECGPSATVDSEEVVGPCFWLESSPPSESEGVWLI